MNVWIWKHQKHSRNAPGSPHALMSPHVSALGKAIEPEWRSTWRPLGSCVFETRRHVGRSAEGFHAGVEVCRRAAVGTIDWSDAHPTPESARLIAADMESERRGDIETGFYFGSDISAFADCTNCGRLHFESPAAPIAGLVAHLENAIATAAAISPMDRQTHRVEFDRALGRIRELLYLAPVEQEHAADVSQHQSALTARTTVTLSNAPSWRGVRGDR